jgi:hypothetical protein
MLVDGKMKVGFLCLKVGSLGANIVLKIVNRVKYIDE